MVSHHHVKIYNIIIMVIQSSGAISLSNIQTEFGGTNPISLSEYYNNSSTGYIKNITDI